MLSLFNGTGRELIIDNLDGLEVNFISFFFSNILLFINKSLLKILR